MKKYKMNKGFTIIELIVVIAVLGVLVLLALPKFLGYTEKANVTQVKSDIVAYEKAVDSKRVGNDKYLDSWEKIDVLKMDSLKKSLFNKKGLISGKNNVAFGGEYYKIPKDSKLVKTSLKGDFYLGQGGEVYYYDEKLANKVNGGSSESEPPASTETFKVTFKDYYGKVIETKTVEKGQAVTPPVNPITGLEIDKWNKDLTNITSDLEVKPVVDGPTDKDLGYSKADFTWVKDSYGYIGLNKGNGYFKYTGTGRSTVEIPHVIQGVPMTSYFFMFYESPAEVTKVISTNKNVTNMRSMCNRSQAISLDLSGLDTSNVTNMNSMFYLSKATSITFGKKFDTSKVTDMSGMFTSTKTGTLDVSNFNTSNVTSMKSMFSLSEATSITFGTEFYTSNVTNMTEMFYFSKASTLDLSSFDTSNVTDITNMNSMFGYGSTRKGYARTQTDADKFNASSNKPTALTFIKKQ